MTDPAQILAAGFDGLGTKLDEMPNRVIDGFQAYELELYRGVKQMRLPLLQATGANPFAMGESTPGGVPVGPQEGFIWAIRRLIVQGLTTGATPDVVNIFRSSSLQEGGLLWQLNGNSFGVTFGKGELTLQPGDRLHVVSVGTFTATGQITLAGEATEVPAPMFAKLLL